MLTGLFLGLLISSTLGFFPSFQDPYLPVRSIALLVFTGLGCASLVFDKVLAERARAATVLVSTVLTWYLLQVILDSLRSGAGSTSMGIIRDLAIATLTLISLHLIRKEPDFLYNFGWLNTLLATLVSGLGLAQLAGAELPWFPAGGLVPETLSNINMMAQYFGLSLVFTIYLLSRESEFLPKTILVLASGCMLAYPLLIVSRSVLIGVCLLLAFAIISRRLHGKEAVALVMATALFSYFIARPVALPKSAQSQKTHWVNRATRATDAAILNQTFGSSSGRQFLWQQTLDMIRDRPWLGFGRGSYEQAASAYVLRRPSPFQSESMVVASPRNEFLQLLSDLGVPLASLLFLGFAALVKNALTAAKTLQGTDDRLQLSIHLGLLLLTEAYFQSPLLQPVGIIFFSILLALLFSLLPTIPLPTLPLPWLRAALGLLSLVFVLQAARLGFAEIASSRPTIADKQLERACRLLPEHWRVCLRYSDVLMGKGRWEEVSQLNTKRLASYPGFHPSERMAALSAWNQGHLSEACSRARRYQQQFQNQSSLQFINHQCEWSLRD